MSDSTAITSTVSVPLDGRRNRFRYQRDALFARICGRWARPRRRRDLGLPTPAIDDILRLHSDKQDVMGEVDGRWIQYVLDGDHQLILLFGKNEFVVHVFQRLP